MIPGYDEVQEVCDQLSLVGLPPCHPWSALLEIADQRFGSRVERDHLTVVSDGSFSRLCAGVRQPAGS